MCEEIFEGRGALDVTNGPEEGGESETRMYKWCMRRAFQKLLNRIMGVKKTVKGMEAFIRMKKTCSSQLGTALMGCCPSLRDFTRIQTG